MKKYNLSAVCGRANQLIKTGVGKSEAFRISWSQEKANSISNMNLSEMARLFEENKTMIEALQAEQELLKAGMIDYMNGREEVEENGYKIKYITVIRQILDTQNFKKEQQDIYKMYLKENESKRFTISA